MLDGLVNEVDVAVYEGTWNLWQLRDKALHLGCHPTFALALEIVLTADFLIEDVDVGAYLINTSWLSSRASISRSSPAVFSSKTFFLNNS